MKQRLVICASGAGSNFEAIVHAVQTGELAAEIGGLIVSRDGAGAVERARRLGVALAVLNPKAFASRDDWDRAMLEQLRVWRADWIALAGFLSLIGPRVLGGFPGRVVNVHPALLPKFGGPGMYGERVHAAVLRSGERETGITVHTIDAEYDRGAILAQERVEILSGDTPESLAERVKSREKTFYPKVLNDLLTGRITSG